MANEEWGPLAGLIGTWEGDKGMDVSFHNEDGKIGDTPYFERTTFKPFGPVDNGTQVLYGLDYRTAAWRKGEENDNPFHTEVGYWLWDSATGEIMKGFVVPRGITVLAGGVTDADSIEFTMEASLGDPHYAIGENKYLAKNASSLSYAVTISIGDDTWSYDEVTMLRMNEFAEPFAHTDHNTLHRVG